MPKQARVLSAILAVSSAAMVLACGGTGGDKHPDLSAIPATSQKSEPTPRLPEVVYAKPVLWDAMMASALGQVVLLGSNESDAEAKEAHLQFNDREAVMKMAVRGSLFPVPIGQKLIVIKRYSKGLIVKIDGGSQNGKQGYVPNENYSITPPK